MEDLLADLTASIPALSLNVRVGGREVFHHTVGSARRRSAGTTLRKATADEAFDLASVTKVLAGASVAASLVADGILELDAPVARHLSGVDPGVTLNHLLSHSAGYPAHVDLWKDISGTWGIRRARRSVIDRARTARLVATPGTRHIYSDLGFLTLLDLMEAVTRRPLEALFEERVRAPSGVRDIRWGWPCAAATEDCPVRGIVVEGTVHDLNTAAMGGVSTHAGLFGTARGVAALTYWLMEQPWVRAMWRRDGPGTHTGGWDTISTGYSSTGGHFPTDTVGHLGYTGTSVWASPSQQTVVVLLTNRVHPDDTPESKEAIRAARPVVHDAVADMLGWS